MVWDWGLNCWKHLLHVFSSSCSWVERITVAAQGQVVLYEDKQTTHSAGPGVLLCTARTTNKLCSYPRKSTRSGPDSLARQTLASSLSFAPFLSSLGRDFASWLTEIRIPFHSFSPWPSGTDERSTEIQEISSKLLAKPSCCQSNFKKCVLHVQAE